MKHYAHCLVFPPKYFIMMHLLSGENFLLILLHHMCKQRNTVHRCIELELPARRNNFFSIQKAIGQGKFQGLYISMQMQYIILVSDLHAFVQL